MGLCPKRGSSLSWCQAQFAHQLGLAADQGLKGMPPAGTPESAQTAGPRRKQDREVASSLVAGGSFLTGYRRNARIALGQYFLAGRRYFAGVHGRSVSLDAARVGGKDLLQGVVLAWKGPDYRAMVAPPIVPGFAC